MVKIEPISKDPLSKRRVENFEILFDLSHRWSKALEDIAETAIAAARKIVIGEEARIQHFRKANGQAPRKAVSQR